MNKHIVIVLIICSIIGYLDGILNHYKLPWGIDVAFTAIVFYGLGNVLKTRYQLLLSKPVLVKIVIACALLIINIVFLNRVNLNMKLHGSYYDFYISAISGLTFCVILSSLISSKILVYLGKNALVIMAFHMLVLNIATKVIAYSGLVTNNYTSAALTVVLTILFLVPLIYFINTFTPFVLGRGSTSSNQSPHVAIHGKVS